MGCSSEPHHTALTPAHSPSTIAPSPFQLLYSSRCPSIAPSHPTCSSLDQVKHPTPICALIFNHATSLAPLRSIDPHHAMSHSQLGHTSPIVITPSLAALHSSRRVSTHLVHGCRSACVSPSLLVCTQQPTAGQVLHIKPTVNHSSPPLPHSIPRAPPVVLKSVMQRTNPFVHQAQPSDRVFTLCC
jgi:hypothetical protein